MKSKIHGFFGVVALLCVLSFWTGTVFVEILGSSADVALAKGYILMGMWVLVPAMALTGMSGFNISKKWKGPVIERKKRRMKIIAANGLLVLLPSAFFLSNLAGQGSFNGWFYGVQAVELIAGATNITLISLNMKDGVAIARKRSKA